MKYFYVVLLLMKPLLGFNQTLVYKIEGSVKSSTTPKYAYLVNYGDFGFLLKTEVKNRAFNFEGTVNSEGAYYRTAQLFLNDRDDITLNEIKSKFNQQIWMPGRDQNIKNVVMENLTILIDSAENIKDAPVMQLESYTAQLQELSLAKKNKTALAFVTKYFDSPVSLSYIQQSLLFFKLSIPKEELELLFGAPMAMYKLLSERLKTGKQGIEVKKQIDEIYKP